MNALSHPETLVRPAPVLAFPRPLPVTSLRWSHKLVALRRVALGLLALLLVVASVFYWWIFSTQSRFEQGYHELTSLRLQIRQMAILNDAFAGDLAGDAAIPVGLSAAGLSQTVRLTLQPERIGRPTSMGEAAPTLVDAPVGY